MSEEYLSVAHRTDGAGAAVVVCVGVAVLAGIAAADAICAAALGERSVGPDHRSAVLLLDRVDPAAARHLRILIDLKGRSHYGHALLTDADRKKALRSAAALVAEAQRRQP